MEQQANENRVVFSHLVSARGLMIDGEQKVISSANPFNQKNAAGELKHIESFEDIAMTANTSGLKLAATFSVK